VNDYQREQREALDLVIEYVSGLSAGQRREWDALLAGYREFRAEVDGFLTRRFGRVCTEKCFHSRLSACCSKDGIVTFFADTVVNVLSSTSGDTDRLRCVLTRPHTGFKCVYLAETGCLWRVKPIVCEMFLCDASRSAVFDADPEARQQWQNLEAAKKEFTWPDRPVLFDIIENRCIQAGLQSRLMYYHNSPGLLRVKRRAARNG
jgi:hypothetical protein